MTRILLVANPASSGFTGALYRDVVRTLGEHFSVEPVWPIDTRDARAQAAAASDNGYEAVVAMGGDGVIHHVANGVAGTGAALGMIPAGTTNVLARIHGIPRDPLAAAATLHQARRTASPTVRVDVGGTGPSLRAVFAAGAGFDADVVEAAERFPHSKLRFGWAHYTRAAVGRVLGARRTADPNLEVVVDGVPGSAASVFIQIHDVYTYLGRVPIRLTAGTARGPSALTVDRIEPMLAGRLAARLIAGRDVDGTDGVSTWDAFDSLRIESADPFAIQADGEHLGTATAVEFSPDPDALIVLRH